MVTIGFKSKTTAFFRAAAAIVLGALIAYICFKGKDPFHILTMTAASLIIVSGVFALVIGFVRREEKDFAVFMVNAALDIIIGVLMFIFAGKVETLVWIILASVLILFTIWEAVVLLSARRYVRTGWMYLIPLLTLVAAVLIIVTSNEQKGWFCAAALVLYGVSELVSAFKMKKAIKLCEEEKETGNVDVPYVEAVKVEDAAPVKEAGEEEKA